MESTSNVGLDSLRSKKKAPKSAAVFFSQIIIIYIVVITSIINLSVQDCSKPGVCNLWIVMLSSAMGYLLPNPSMRIGTRNAMEKLGSGATMGFDVTDSKPDRGSYMNETRKPGDSDVRKPEDCEEEEQQEEENKTGTETA